MDIMDEPIDADRYRVASNSFEAVDRESDPYVKIAAILGNSIQEQQPTKFWLKGPDEEINTRIAYTAALDLSDTSERTIPIFEIALPGSDGFQNVSSRSRTRNDEMSAYTDHLRSLFVEEDQHERLVGLGPIGKCLRLSQERNVMLFLKGIDRVPGRAQSMFFGILERRPKIQYAIEVQGDPENLTIFSTTNPTADREELDRKLRSILGTAYRIEGNKD